MQVKLTLGENHVDIEIEKFNCSYPLKSIEYPAHILSVESGVRYKEYAIKSGRYVTIKEKIKKNPVGYWQHGTPSGREDHANHVLLDLLCAQPSSWSITYNQWKDLKPLIKETYDLLSPLHENTAHSAMVNHEVLSGDFMVQKSEFKNGTKVWVNYGITTHKTGKLEIPPKGFRISYSDGRVVSGNLSRSIHLNHAIFNE